MRIIKKIKEMKRSSKEAKNKGKKIGFVPTMGALHEGQLTLINLAKKRTDFVVVSIFVNPLQFGPREDFNAYPRDLNRDAKLLRSRGVPLLFAPEVKEMFADWSEPPPKAGNGSGAPIQSGMNRGASETYVEVPGLSSVLCGAKRHGHFRGVCTVVCKLFNIVQPALAVFGEKDAQQAIIIKKMVRDLNLGVKILTAPTIREPDGLAMSSRNIYLSPEERKDASVIYQALIEAKGAVEKGERDAKKIKEKIRTVILGKPTAKIDYIDIVKKSDLKRLKTLPARPLGAGREDEVLIAVAVWFGKARLIDNITLQL